MLKSNVKSTSTQKFKKSLTSPAQSKLWVKIGYAALIAALISGVADFLGIIHIFSSSKDDSMQLTVYVQGIDHKPIHALQNNGKVLANFGNDLRAPLIGENGRTNLGEIPKKFQGDTIPIALEAGGYQPVEPNKKFIMDGKPVYFLVKKDDSLGLIEGIVKDRSGEKFIDGALVMIENDTITYTDSLGRFRLILPPNKQRDTYSITVKKKGYKTKNAFFKPKTGPQEIRLNK